MLALGGDGDRDIDVTDFNVLAQNFSPMTTTGANWTTADFDGDMDIDVTDFNRLASNFSPSGYGASQLVHLVPESFGGLLGVALSGLLLWSHATFLRCGNRAK